jgi:hypothetical protein
MLVPFSVLLHHNYYGTLSLSLSFLLFSVVRRPSSWLLAPGSLAPVLPAPKHPQTVTATSPKLQHAGPPMIQSLAHFVDTRLGQGAGLLHSPSCPALAALVPASLCLANVSSPQSGSQQVLA